MEKGDPAKVQKCKSVFGHSFLGYTEAKKACRPKGGPQPGSWASGGPLLSTLVQF